MTLQGYDQYTDGSCGYTNATEGAVAGYTLASNGMHNKRPYPF
jgi:hypothetical protein